MRSVVDREVAVWTASGVAAPGRLRGVPYPRRPSGLRRVLLPLLALLLLPGGWAAAQLPPPDGEWRSVESEHYRVTYPAGLDSLGREVAELAEVAHARLARAFLDPPEGRTEILLTDHVDVSNGIARVSPYKQITIFARPPVDGFAISHFDDWLELVLVHEIAHVFHLDRTGPLGGVLRSVFGRVPFPWPFFPQLGAPRWTIEGLATWYESSLTGAGRVHGTFHEMVLRTAVLEDRFEGIGAASGESPEWPAGQRSYVYGSLFFDHLLERYGADRMEEFVDAVAGQWVPYRLNAASEEAFGVSFSRAWEEWRRELRARATALEEELAGRRPLTRPERITGGLRVAYFPQISPDGTTLVYARSDGLSDSQLRRSTPSGSASERLVRTNTSAPFDFTPDGRIVLSQLELQDPYRMYGDLWIADTDGDLRRLTEGARLDHPSVGPEGEEAVAVRTGAGTTQLVTVDLASGEVTALAPADADVHWAYPAVSPDGRLVAAVRWTPGTVFDLVVLDRANGEVVSVVTRDRALDTAPAWSPDGRWLLWVSDRSGIQNLFAAAVDPSSRDVGEARQVTNLLTGAHFPSVSPDGRWLYFSGYHADGWGIERIPFEPAGFFDPFPLDPRFDPPGPGSAEARVDPGGEADDLRSSPYDPLLTLAPGFWAVEWAPSVRTGGVDVLGSSWGFSTSASDLVGRHDLSLRLLASTTDAKLSGGIGYTWRGLGNPHLSIRGRQGWDAGGPFGLEGEDGEVRPVFVEERERSAALSTTFRHVRFRRAAALTLSGGMVWESRRLLEADLSEAPLALRDARLSDLRASASFSTARGHALSMGLEEGVILSVTGRTRDDLDVPADRRGRPGSDRSVDEVLGELRGYRGVPGPGFSDHVVALRVSGGVGRGPGADPFHYDVGGTSGGPDPFGGLSLFGGTSRFFPVRGFTNGDRSGRNAWSATAEYRFPLALVNEGAGLLPIHLDRLAGSLFVDAGNAWGPDEQGGVENLRRDPLVSAGGELVTELLTFFAVPVTLRTGVAVRLTEGAGTTTGYLRLGRSF